MYPRGEGEPRDDEERSLKTVATVPWWGRPPSKPVIAVVVFVVATIVISAALYNWAMQFVNTDKAIPEFDLTAHHTEDGYFAIELTERTYSVPPWWVEFTLRYASGEVVEEGDAREVYGLDMEFSPCNVSFVDRDQDGYVGTADYFLLRPLSKGGAAEEGQEFILVFPVTGERSGKIRLPSERSDAVFPAPTTSWKVLEQDWDAIHLDREQAATSRSVSLMGQELGLRIIFQYTGDARCLTLQFTGNSGETLACEEGLVEEGETITFLCNYTECGGDWEHQNMEFSLKVWDAESRHIFLHANLSLTFTYATHGDPSFSSGPLTLLLALAVVAGGGAARSGRKKQKRQYLAGGETRHVPPQ